jgi:hypothetical protein
VVTPQQYEGRHERGIEVIGRKTTTIRLRRMNKRPTYVPTQGKKRERYTSSVETQKRKTHVAT